MTNLIFITVVATLAIAGTATAQTSTPSNDRNQATPRLLLTPAPEEKGPAPTARRQQTAQGSFDPWRATHHELDNIADKLNACMLHPPAAQAPCIDQAIHNP